MPKSKHTLLPLLVILFLVSYGIMALLVVEQGRTIDSQRYLIRQLFGDSSELSAMKGKAVQEHNRAQAQARANAQAQASPDAKVQPQAPSTMPQAAPKQNSRTMRKKVGRPPLRPPQDASDMADERRALVSI